jgi:DNA topoisomerase-1
MCAAFRQTDAAETPASKRVLQAVDAVAGMLGNTRAVCRKSYIHPAVIDACAEGTIAEISGPVRRRRGLTPDECSVLAVLDRLAKQAKKKAA